MRRACLVLLVVAVSMTGTGVASADTRFRGESKQGRAVTLNVRDDGLARRFKISWQAPCTAQVTFVRSSTTFLPPFDVVRPDRVVDAGDYRERFDRGRRVVYRVRTAGNRLASGGWKGTFRLRAKVLRGGRLLSRCSLDTRWRATPVATGG